MLQSCFDLWHAEHVGRITSSMVHRVLKRRQTTAPEQLVAAILGLDGGCHSKTLHLSDPRQNGHSLEVKARQAYLGLQTERGQPVEVQLDGLFVSRQ